MATKKENKKKIKELREVLKKTHKDMRDEEIQEHNGKPFTSRNLPVPKTKYTRKTKHKEDY